MSEVYGGDYFAFAEDYFALVGELYERTRCDVIAHFDLITKYNEGNALFDPSHPRYRLAAETALNKLMSAPVLLEVNTGAIARGYRSTPYPEPWIREQWLAAGKELILSSDCHDRRFLLCGFDALQSVPHRETLPLRSQLPTAHPSSPAAQCSPPIEHCSLIIAHGSQFCLSSISPNRARTSVGVSPPSLYQNSVT